MTDDEAKQMKFTAEDKLQYEVKKLTEEVRVLQHPFSQPGSWIAAIALIVSIGTNVLQHFAGRRTEQLARTEKSEAKLAETQVKEDREKQEKKRDQASEKIEDVQNKLADFNTQLVAAQRSGNCETLNKTVSEVREKVLTLEKDTQAVTQSLNKPESADAEKYKTARDEEREGFQNLIDGNYDNAIAAFQASEDIYNSYHNVYELARLIRANKSQMNDPVKKKEIFQTIVREYSWGAPPELLAQIKTIANQ